MSCPVLTDKSGEVPKGTIHLALGGLALVCAAYNLVACTVRPTARLKVQAVAYSALAVFEAHQVYRHWSGK
jgi:hypothetical protein